MFGSTTALGHYCPIGMVITNKEDEKAQDFLFEFIKENANVLPSFCMADAAKATSKSLEKTLPETIRLMCWWHKHKNTKTQLAFVRSADPGIYSSIVSDLKDLQLLPIDEESWREVYQLFVKKWSHYEFYDKELKEIVMKFLSYVKTTWIDDARVSKWYQAANPQALSTNNALESNNGKFKVNFTSSKRHSLPTLFVMIGDYLKEASENDKKDLEELPSNQKLIEAEKYLDDYKEFFTTKPLDEKKRKHKTIIQENSGIYRGKTISVTAMPNIPYEKSEAEWRDEVSRKHRKRTEMDEFVETSKQVIFVETVSMKNVNQEEEKFCVCSCELGLKGKLCKHGLALTMLWKWIEKPSEQELIGRFSKKRGRDAKSKKQGY